ncbi:MAG: recombinase family protein, partial [Clostridia bacterium]|nr:recombinase family protein [Clostridia bacterium]
SVFAQLERDTITERLSGGRRQKAGTGGYAGGGAALGYTAARGTKILLPDPEGAAAVRRVFELHAAGLRLQAIADRLNAEGRATKRGARFSPTQVMRILRRRELYEGGYSYGGVSAVGQHSALLPVIPPAGGIQVST